MEIAQIFFEAFLSLLIFFLTGSVIALFFPSLENTPQKVFFKLIAGILFWIIGISLFATSFKTINILAFLSFLFLWKKEGKPPREIQLQYFFPKKTEIKYLVLCLLALSCFIGVQCYRNEYFNLEYVYLSNADYSFYITMAEYQFLTDVERFTPWYELHELSKGGGAEPYHYGDIWLTSAFLQWCETSPLKMYLYILLPVISTVSFTGLHTLYSNHSPKSNNYVNIFICFLMMFSIGGIPFVREAFGFSILPLTSPKSFLFFSLCTLGFIFLLKNKHQIFITILCIVPIFHIIYAPLIFTTTFVWSGYFYFFKREKWTKYGLLFPVLMTLGIVLFYLLFGKYSTYYDGTSKLELAVYLKGFLITSFRDVLSRAIVFYLPVITLMGWIWKNKNYLSHLDKQVFSFSGVLLLMTIFFRGLLNYNGESLQIPQMIFNPLLTIMLLFIFSLLVKNDFFNKKYKLLINIFIIIHLVSSIFILLNNYTQKADRITFQFLNQIKYELAELPRIGVFITTSEDINFHSVNPHLCYVAEPLKLIGKNKWVHSISTPEEVTNFPFPERISSIVNTPFYKFIQQEKKNNNYTTYGKAQKDFVEKYRIGYVLIEKGGVLTEELASIISKMIEEENGAFRVGIFKQ